MTLRSGKHGAEQGAIPVAGGLRARFQKLVKEPFRIGRRDLVELRVCEAVYHPGDPRFLRLPSVMMELRPCRWNAVRMRASTSRRGQDAVAAFSTVDTLRAPR